MDLRQLKAQQIAQQGGIVKTAKGWKVPSQSGHGAYTVQRKFLISPPECDCPDYQSRKQPCKHIYAVELILKQETDAQGNITITQTKRITYPQNWKAYNTAQTNEIEQFDILLKDLVSVVQNTNHDGRGRPNLSMQESLFCTIQKVYSQLSQRRAHTLYRNAEGKEQIAHTPHFNAIGKLLNQGELTPILHELLTLSALPLKSVETTFAPDSSGFRTSSFNQYAVEKYKTRREHKWIKAHILVGTKTNIVASARITEGKANDSPYFEPLVTEAHENGFMINEITADKGYTSRANYTLAHEIGATAYIPFKSNATGRAGRSLTWKKMFHYFQLNREEFMQHYHQRSNVESTFNMIKAKFGDKVKSKNWIAQQNELLCKLIAHNIVVVIHEMYELGVKRLCI